MVNRQMNKAQKTQSQVTMSDREGVRMLAIEIGAREAARKLGLNENTVLGWSRRYGWKLPKRHKQNGPRKGALKCTQAIMPKSAPGDVLLATHEELKEQSKTALLQTVAKAAMLVAEKPAMDITTTAQLRDLALTIAKLCDDKPGTTVNVGVGVQVPQVDTAAAERERFRLIDQLTRLQQLNALPAQDAVEIAAEPAQTAEQQPAPEQQPAVADDVHAQPLFEEVPAKAPPEPSTGPLTLPQWSAAATRTLSAAEVAADILRNQDEETWSNGNCGLPVPQ